MSLLTKNTCDVEALPPHDVTQKSSSPLALLGAAWKHCGSCFSNIKPSKLAATVA